jgi:hypothetical protein
MAHAPASFLQGRSNYEEVVDVELVVVEWDAHGSVLVDVEPELVPDVELVVPFVAVELVLLVAAAASASRAAVVTW